MTGAPYDIHDHDYYTKDTLWDLLKHKDNEKDMIQTHTSGRGDTF